MFSATIIGFIGIGLALVIVLLVLHQSGDTKTADAIGLVGVALIGAGVALYVGHNADENAARIGAQADENTRTVGINNILAQIERVQDSQQGIKPCSRYLVHQKVLIKFLVRNELPKELPADPDKTLCLAGYLAHASQALDGDDLRAAEWLYIREQIISFLNVVELASAYSTHAGDKPISHAAAQSQKSDLSGQEMLIRFVDGALGNDIKSVMREILPEYNQTRSSDLTLNGLWRICATVDCNEKVRNEESHSN